MASEVGPAEQHVNLIQCRREGETCTTTHRNTIMDVHKHYTNSGSYIKPV